MIVEVMPLGMFQTNCYLVGCPQTYEAMVLDPGGDPNPVLGKAEALGLAIGQIVNTHGHFDHIAGNAALIKETGASLAIHELDAPRLYEARYDRSILMGLRRERSQPTRLLKERDVVQVGQLSFEVLHTPGHTPGGICLLGDGVLFSGDTLFNLGIGRTDLPGGDMSTLIHSLERILWPLDDDLVVYPGHGPRTTLGYEKRHNPFL